MYSWVQISGRGSEQGTGEGETSGFDFLMEVPDAHPKKMDNVMANKMPTVTARLPLRFLFADIKSSF